MPISVEDTSEQGLRSRKVGDCPITTKTALGIVSLLRSKHTYGKNLPGLGLVKRGMTPSQRFVVSVKQPSLAEKEIGHLITTIDVANLDVPNVSVEYCVTIATLA
jgi:hypothetical protein